MNVQDEIKALKERIAELEEHVKEEQEFPQLGDEYWCIGEWLLPAQSIYEDDYTDRGRKQYGNIYKNKEEAEFAIEKLKVEADLRKFSRPFKEGENNYYLELYLSDKALSIDSDDYFQSQGTFYFDSEKIALKAINTVGEYHIKKYIFGVEG